MNYKFSDLFWYIVIGLLTVVGIAVWVAFAPSRDWIDKGWAWFLWFTTCLFIFLGKIYWRVRKPKTFWPFLLVLLLVHILAYARFIRYIQHAFLYLLLMPIEGMIIALIVNFVFGIMPAPKTQI